MPRTDEEKLPCNVGRLRVLYWRTWSIWTIQVSLESVIAYGKSHWKALLHMVSFSFNSVYEQNSRIYTSDDSDWHVLATESELHVYAAWTYSVAVISWMIGRAQTIFFFLLLPSDRTMFTESPWLLGKRIGQYVSDCPEINYNTIRASLFDGYTENRLVLLGGMKRKGSMGTSVYTPFIRMIASYPLYSWILEKNFIRCRERSPISCSKYHPIVEQKIIGRAKVISKSW